MGTNTGTVRQAIASATTHPTNVHTVRMLTTATLPMLGTCRRRPTNSGTY